MERIKELNRYQKGILLLLIAMVSVFTILYAIAFFKTGFVYGDAFLEKRIDSGNTVYTGYVKGERLTYTVAKDKALTCTYGDKTYGPFTAKKDSTAVPWTNGAARDMVGVEIREGEEILFRGGVLITNERKMSMVLVPKEVHIDQEPPIYTGYMKPSPELILQLLSGPKLTKGGNFWTWLGGMIVAAFTALSIVFAEELFHFRLSFSVRYAELAEPSEWEIISRYAGWALGVFATPIIFFMGLTMYI